MSTARTIKVALVGAGMFGGDVHLRTYCQLQQHGLLPWLGRLGLDDKARALGVTTNAIARATQAVLTGVAVGQYRDADKLIDIIMRTPRSERDTNNGSSVRCATLESCGTRSAAQP